MSFIDKRFLTFIKIEIKRTSSKLKMKEIDSKTHDIFEYCVLNLYFRDLSIDQSKITHIREEFHLVNDLDVNILIEINIISSKKCILNFKSKSMIFLFCDNIQVFITIIHTNQSMNCSVFVAQKTVVSFHINMVVSIKIREKLFSNRDYIFDFIKKILLDLENEFFNHIMMNNFVKILVRNTSIQLYVISKNCKIESITNYHKNECFAMSLKKKHLIIVFNKLFKQNINSEIIHDSRKIENKNLETILFNEIIVHDNENTIVRITTMINEYLEI